MGWHALHNDVSSSVGHFAIAQFALSEGLTPSKCDFWPARTATFVYLLTATGKHYCSENYQLPFSVWVFATHYLQAPTARGEAPSETSTPQAPRPGHPPQPTTGSQGGSHHINLLVAHFFLTLAACLTSVRTHVKG